MLKGTNPICPAMHTAKQVTTVTCEAPNKLTKRPKILDSGAKGQ